LRFKIFGVCDFSRLAVTDWRLRRWRLWFLALTTATRIEVAVNGLKSLAMNINTELCEKAPKRRVLLAFGRTNDFIELYDSPVEKRAITRSKTGSA